MSASSPPLIDDQQSAAFNLQPAANCKYSDVLSNNIARQTYMNEAVILWIVTPTRRGRSAWGNHWNIILCASQASPCQKQEDNVILSISIYHSSLKTSTKILESCNKHKGRQAWHRLWLALGWASIDEKGHLFVKSQLARFTFYLVNYWQKRRLSDCVYRNSLVQKCI